MMSRAAWVLGVTLEQLPIFAMFPLADDVGLGLWSRHAVETAVPGPNGISDGASGVGMKIAFIEGDVGAVHPEWAGLSVPILQPPTALDVGQTVVAVDLEGYQLRV